MSRAEAKELPGIEGPGVAPFKDSALTKLGGKLDDLRDQRATLAEQITQAEKSAVERMIELGISRYRYGDREMILKPGNAHVKTKEVKGDNSDDGEDEAED